MMYSEQFLKRRRFLTFLPVLVLPFITLLFWILGGGRGNEENTIIKPGLNLQLPDANAKSLSPIDKLKFYQAADADSVKRLQQIAADPNFKEAVPFKLPVYRQPVFNEEKINNRISRIQRQIEEPEPVQIMMQPSARREADPEMEAINGTLEKILDIQHPERVKEKLSVKKSVVYQVSGTINVNDYLGKPDSAKNGFYDGVIPEKKEEGLSAVVQGEQIIENGSIIKFRLLNDLFVNGNKIPGNSFIYGDASIDGNLVKAHISSIETDNAKWPVSLYATIYVYGSIGGEVAKQSADNAVQSLGILNYDPSLKAQATTAGIGAVKSLFSKKLKRQTVTIKSGYRVLLENEQNW